MGFCTQCGANLGEIEAALRHALPYGMGRGSAPGPLRDERDQMAPFLASGERPAAGGPRREGAEGRPVPPADPTQKDRDATQTFPRVTRPQADAREEPHGSSVWHPDAARTERIGPVQHGGAQAPWIRPAGPSERRFGARPLAVLGGAVALAGSFLPWIRWDFGRTAFHFPLRFLVTGELTGRMPSVGLVLAILAGVGLVLSLVTAAAGPRRLIGFLVLAVPVLFATLGLQPSDLSHLFRVLGIGAYAAALGGLLLLFG